MDRRVVLLAALAAHLAVSVAHGGTHALVPVGLSPPATALVAATTFVGPVVGAALAWRGHPLGAPLFAASMAGALALGGYLHFLLENPDNVRAVPAGPWQLPFQASAVGVALANAAGAVVGAWCWRGG